LVVMLSQEMNIYTHHTNFVTAMAALNPKIFIIFLFCFLGFDLTQFMEYLPFVRIQVAHSLAGSKTHRITTKYSNGS
jgi:hypothetical protein